VLRKTPSKEIATYTVDGVPGATAVTAPTPRLGKPTFAGAQEAPPFVVLKTPLRISVA